MHAQPNAGMAMYNKDMGLRRYHNFLFAERLKAARDRLTTCTHGRLS